MNDNINEINLVNAICSVGFSPISYSGRGMYGNKCVSFRVPGDFDIFREIGEVIDEFIGKIAETEGNSLDTLTIGAAIRFVTDCIKTDNMGMSTVVYFPDIEWTDEMKHLVDTLYHSDYEEYYDDEGFDDES